MLMLTVSLFWSSESFLPTSLLVHSSVLSPELEVIPGTTRGMLVVSCGLCVEFGFAVFCAVR